MGDRTRPLRDDETPLGAHAKRELYAGRYRLGEFLGKGATSTVVGAYDTLLERPVALKILHADLGARGILSREARILASVRHPNVVVVHALHEDEEPPCIVMEWVEGERLDHFVAEHPISFQEARRFLRQIADGLDAIHAAGLAHGDMKPENVMVGRDGRLRIVDVGLVPILERMEQGDILGTPAYMAPERARGMVATPELDARSDVYSFAVLAFELLTGDVPFRAGGSEALLYAHAHLPPPRPSAVSCLGRVFDEPFARALSKWPEQRYPRAGALVDAIETAARGVDASGAALRVLVVDDDDDTRALFAFGLASTLRGSVVETASDGFAALETIRRRPPAVAVVDLRMPGLSGVDLVRLVHAQLPSLPLVVCTGEGSGREWTQVRALGVRQFLVKPVDPVMLGRAIRDAVDGVSATAPTRIW